MKRGLSVVHNIHVALVVLKAAAKELAERHIVIGD
jgi:hypothetical protein